MPEVHSTVNVDDAAFAFGAAVVKAADRLIEDEGLAPDEGSYVKDVDVT